MAESTNEIFEKVRDIIAEFQLVDRSRITMDSDICMDLGVAGDDGDELFSEFEKAFEVDWTGLDLGVHFGGEGFGVPLLWGIKDDCVMYHHDPCTVSKVVQAVETGRWPGTKLIRKSKSDCAKMYVLSAIETAVLGGLIFSVTLYFV